jgi:hypothetical protein
MVRLLEIPFGNPPCRRCTTPSSRTKLGRKLVICIWVYRTKSAGDGKINRYKAKLVTKGVQHVHGIDYDETFSPAAKMHSICLELSIEATKVWEVHRMVVKNEFLHADLSKDIYMDQPQGFM